MLAEAVRRREELEREEERYWREYSRHKHKLLQAEDEYRYLTYKQKFTTNFGIGFKSSLCNFSTEIFRGFLKPYV